VNDRGFVDTFADVNILRDGGVEIVGVADAVFCASCIEQMGNRVGMASRKEVEEFAYREFEKDTELVKLKDEVQSWSDRFDTIVSESFTAQVKKVIEQVGREGNRGPVDPASA